MVERACIVIRRARACFGLMVSADVSEVSTRRRAIAKRAATSALGIEVIADPMPGDDSVVDDRASLRSCPMKTRKYRAALQARPQTASSSAACVSTRFG